MEKTVLTVEGMACEHCVMTITRAVGALPGVVEVSVDLKEKLVTVTYDPARTMVEKIKNEIQEQGYDVVA